jgi:hypothetical protein
VDESSDYVGEVGQFLEIADSVPIRRLDPVVRVHRLILAVYADILSSLQEEVVLLSIDFLQSDGHHEPQQQFVLFEEPSARVSVDPCLELIRNRI